MATYLRRCRLIVLLVLIASLFSAVLHAAAPVVMHEDARLNDIFAADERLVWAVGDRGTIWHSADGGSNWRLQDATVDCPCKPFTFSTARMAGPLAAQYNPIR